jgi:hypothetical protein
MVKLFGEEHECESCSIGSKCPIKETVEFVGRMNLSDSIQSSKVQCADNLTTILVAETRANPVLLQATLIDSNSITDMLCMVFAMGYMHGYRKSEESSLSKALSK